MGRVRLPLTGQRLDIPYAYQNGRAQLIKPEVFRLSKRSEATDKAMKLAVQSKLVEDGGVETKGKKRKLLERCHLIVVPRFEDDGPKVREGIETVFDKFGVDAMAADRLLERVEREACGAPPLSEAPSQNNR